MLRSCLAEPLEPRHRPDAHWVMHEAQDIRARCSLWWRSVPSLPGETLGLLGHYSAQDAEAGRRLLKLAACKLAARGCTMAVGPLDGNTWHSYRLVTERGPDPPFFLEPDNPADWPEHFREAGFAALARYQSVVTADLRAWNGHTDLAGLRIRTLDLTRLDQELAALYRLAVTGFADSFLYTPISEREFAAQYLAVLPRIRPELVLLAEGPDGLAGFLFGIPDVLQQKRGLPIDTVVLKTLCVAPEFRGMGLGSLLATRAYEQARLLGYSRAIHALMHEQNLSRKINAAGVRRIREYTLFARKLELS